MDSKIFLLVGKIFKQSFVNCNFFGLGECFAQGVECRLCGFFCAVREASVLANFLADAAVSFRPVQLFENVGTFSFVTCQELAEFPLCKHYRAAKLGIVELDELGVCLAQFSFCTGISVKDVMVRIVDGVYCTLRILQFPVGLVAGSALAPFRYESPFFATVSDSCVTCAFIRSHDGIAVAAIVN